jgi:hypothetical protein
MRAAIYCRVSTLDQHPETQLLDLQQLASQRNLTVVQVYTDHGFSGAKSRRPGLDQMLYDARRHQFDVVLVWAADRLARSVKHFVDILAELDHLKIGFISLPPLDESEPVVTSSGLPGGQKPHTRSRDASSRYLTIGQPQVSIHACYRLALALENTIRAKINGLSFWMILPP